MYYPYSETPHPGGAGRRREPLKEPAMLPNQCTLKRFPSGLGRRPGPGAPFRSASGITALGALRFELSWHYREPRRDPFTENGKRKTANGGHTT